MHGVCTQPLYNKMLRIDRVEIRQIIFSHASNHLTHFHLLSDNSAFIDPDGCQKQIPFDIDIHASGVMPCCHQYHRHHPIQRIKSIHFSCKRSRRMRSFISLPRYSLHSHGSRVRQPSVLLSLKGRGVMGRKI